VPAVVPEAGDADVPRIASALVAIDDGTGLQVVCGERQAVGTASARLRDFPAGPCTVTATYLGRSYTTSVVIDRRREVRCAVQGEALACR
jgi:hypothetical protein